MLLLHSCSEGFVTASKRIVSPIRESILPNGLMLRLLVASSNPPAYAGGSLCDDFQIFRFQISNFRLPISPKPPADAGGSPSADFPTQISPKPLISYWRQPQDLPFCNTSPKCRRSCGREENFGSNNQQLPSPASAGKSGRASGRVRAGKPADSGRQNGGGLHLGEMSPFFSGAGVLPGPQTVSPELHLSKSGVWKKPSRTVPQRPARAGLSSCGGSGQNTIDVRNSSEPLVAAENQTIAGPLLTRPGSLLTRRSVIRISLLRYPAAALATRIAAGYATLESGSAAYSGNVAKRSCGCVVQSSTPPERPTRDG